MTQLIIKIFIISLLCIAPIHAQFTSETQPNSAYSEIHKKEIVVLVHGLMRSYLSMQPLKFYLEKQGYKVYYYAYPSTKYTIQDHGNCLKQFISHLFMQHPKTTIHFITHSLGGIITREALAQLPPNQIENVGYLIMLAPPNHGSLLAKIATKTIPLVSYFIKPLGELSSDKNSYIHSVPIPKVRMGIIAGRLDAKVSPSSARLNKHVAIVLVNATHTFIMNHTETQKLISNFLNKGTFKEKL